jgi:hypothetical protein
MGWLDAPGVLDELGADVAAELERELGLEQLEPHGPVEEAAQLIALLTAALRDGAGRHDDWPVAWHESLCAQPHELFPPLAEAVGLAWDGRADRLLDELNRPGEGYETARVASSLTDVWRSRLTPEEVRVASPFFDRLDEPWPAGR